MQARHRTYFEALLLLGLCAAIALASRNSDSYALFNAVGWAMLILPGLGFAIYAVWQFFVVYETDISLLSGALWELIRLMETRPRNGSTSRADGRKKLLELFAVEGAHKVAAGRPLPMGDTAGLDLTQLAFELIDRNERDGAGYASRVNSLRRGLFIFYAIFKLEKPELAFRAMCEHMRIQLRSGDDSGMENYAELKRLLGLPTEWPTDVDQIASLERWGLAWERQAAIRNAASRGRSRIFRDVQYVPPDKAGTVHQTPEAILDQMRDYIR